jgi:hypothetical protein
VVVDDQRARDLECQLDREERHRCAPHLVPGSVQPGEVEQPTGRDRRGRDARQQLGSIVD